MPEPLVAQKPPPSIHAMGMQVNEPVNVLHWDDPRCEGKVQINVPSPVSCRIDKDLVVLFPVGTYAVPVRITTSRQVMNDRNTYDEVPLVTYIGGFGDDTRAQRHDGVIISTGIHWFLKQHGAKHTGIVLEDVQSTSISRELTPPAPDARDELIRKQAEQIDEMGGQIKKLTRQLDRLLERLDAPPAEAPAAPAPMKRKRSNSVTVERRAGPPAARKG